MAPAAAVPPPSHFAKRPAVEINFSDLHFCAGEKIILNGISGAFRAGELSAVIGPSGAGKSTLMNILAGYVTRGVQGRINMNGEPRQLKIFNKLSSYIMQEDQLEPFLTVKEVMQVAALLKLGNELSADDKLLAIKEILSTLGLTDCIDTPMDKLSGGQRKRVSIALELVNNPPVIFLDEPTSGLDICSMNQCLDLLKLLASQGRTVICTIHQPSATVFEAFDWVYIMAEGKCVYQGTPLQLVPFLASLSLHCPSTYNPADYVLELMEAKTVYAMSDLIQNGKQQRGVISKTFQAQTSLLYSKDSIEELPILGNSLLDFPTTSWEQFKLLFSMMAKQKWRNKPALWLQVIHHAISATLVGAVFFGIGDSASKPMENFKFCLCACVFYIYTHCMIPVVAYPNDVKIMKREYFNRWYNLKSYYLAKSLSSLPPIVILGWLYCLALYLLTQQPLEWQRFAWFSAVTTFLGITSEGLGMSVGFMFSCTKGSIIGPGIMSAIMVLAIQGMGHGALIGPWLHFLMKLSYLRNGLVAMVTALYLNERVMSCDDSDIYCYYKDPKTFVRDLGMHNSMGPGYELLGLIFYCVFFRVLAFLALQYRVSTQFSSRITSYVEKLVSIKSKKAVNVA